MPNKIESFNNELSRVQLAVTRILKNSNALDKKSENITKQKIEYFNSSECLEDLFVVGERYDQHFQNRNGGISRREFDHLKRIDPENTKRVNVKKADLENDDLNKISQRLSECHSYFAYHKEFEAARVEMQEGEKPKACMSLTGLITHMKADQIFPYDAPKKTKSAQWVVDQVFKMLEKNELTLEQFMATFGKDERVTRHIRGNKIVKEMGSTKVTPEKTTNEKGVSIAA